MTDVFQNLTLFVGGSTRKLKLATSGVTGFAADLPAKEKEKRKAASKM
jgi:hypothetical protein